MYLTSFALRRIGSVNSFVIFWWEYNFVERQVKSLREWIPRLFEVFVLYNNIWKNKYELCIFKNTDVWRQKWTTEHMNQSIRCHSRKSSQISPSFRTDVSRTTSLPIFAQPYVEPRLSQIWHSRTSSHNSSSFGTAISRATHLQVLAQP
jgi:hypothetical protein